MKIEAQEIYLCDGIAPAIVPEGDLITLECALDGVGKKLVLGLSPEAAKLLHYQLGLMITTSLDDKTPLGGAGFARMTEVVDAGANAVDEPGKVLLSLKTPMGSAHYFALPVATSASLRPKLRSAEAAAARGVRLPRA